MNQEQTRSSLFAHSRIDTIPVLAALAHLAFDFYLIVGFASRPRMHRTKMRQVHEQIKRTKAGPGPHDPHLSRGGFLAKENRALRAA
jgi:hypothetical protein